VSSRVTDCPAVQRLADGPDGKQPYFISAAVGRVLSFAALWDRWKNPETGEPMTSCTIIVTDANALTRPIHDRMPVVLDKADIKLWLSGEAGAELSKASRGRSPSHVAGYPGASTRLVPVMTTRR
jgi:putative SOS response-associated peptidase YedK